jgi:hypothetical protein
VFDAVNDHARMDLLVELDLGCQCIFEAVADRLFDRIVSIAAQHNVGFGPPLFSRIEPAAVRQRNPLDSK